MTTEINEDRLFDNDALRELVIDSYDLMLSIKGLKRKGSKYEIQSRSKLKNLPESLREFEDAESSIVHFVKSAAYFLPRSDANLNDYLDRLLDKVQIIQNSEKDPEKVREKLRYLIGYSNWNMDSVIAIFEKSENDGEMLSEKSTTSLYN